MGFPTTHQHHLATTRRQWRISKPQLAFVTIILLSLLPYLGHAVSGRIAAITKASPTGRAVTRRPSKSNGLVPINPTTRSGDVHEMLTSYVGPEQLRVALEQNLAQPLSLAAADFDEDGIPDLVTGYANDGRGIVSVLRGNVDSIYPNGPGVATGSLAPGPFISPAQVFDVSVAADFIGAGDFDADGHWDIVVAARGKKSLTLLRGDGHGNLAEASAIELPGVVTALITGEINRADGLTDVVVAVGGEAGAQVLVFEGPAGALKSSSESFSIPAPATSLALGQLSSAYTIDLAVAAGSELVVVFGRDRSFPLQPQESVHPAVIERRSFSGPLKSVAIGDFDGLPQSEIAVLVEGGGINVLSRGAGTVKSPARSRGPVLDQWVKSDFPSAWPGGERLVAANFSPFIGDDLLLLDSVGQRVRILEPGRQKESGAVALLGAKDARQELTSLALEGGEPLAVLPMRLDVDALTDLVVLRQNEIEPVVVLTTQNTIRHAGPTEFASATNLPEIPVSGVALGAKPQAGPAQISQPEITSKPSIPVETPAVKSGTKEFRALDSQSAGCPTSTISLGQTINGTLATTDCFLNDGNYVDLYTFTGTKDQQVSIILNSLAFDAYLYLVAPDGTLLSADDDAGGGNNARIPSAGGFFTLPANATYTIYATSFSAKEVGAYSLTLTGPAGGACPAIKIPTDGQQSVAASLGPPDCFFTSGDRAGSFVDLYTFDGFAGQQAAIAMASNSFDTYLYLVGPDGSKIAENDDAFGSNSRIPQSGGITLQANGVYTIYATSFTGGATGSYEIVMVLVNPPPASTVVTNTLDSGTGSLRQAILNANSNQGPDIISFKIPNAPFRISPQTALPEITDLVFIDGTTQTGFAGTPLIELDGTFTPPGTAGLKITAGNSRVRGLVINNFGKANCTGTLNAVGSGIVLASAGNNIIDGNFIGTNLSGTAAACNSGNGVFMFNSSNNTIGGATPAARNIISGNRLPGIAIGGEFSILNLVQGNFVGTDKTGTVDLGNQSNGIIVINGTGHLITGNLVSGNDSPGIALGFSDPAGILVQGNFIGTNAAGTAAIPNLGGGIIVGGFFQLNGAPITATDNTIGGTSPAARNVISGNLRSLNDTNPDAGNGVEIINAGSQRNKVQGNFIGLNAAGTAVIPNAGSGVFITRAPNNFIGGDVRTDITGTTNYIAGNGRYGVGVGIRRSDTNSGQSITGGDSVDIVFNVIGTDPTQTLRLGNALDGVFVDADSVDIYVNSNVIAFNGRAGVRIPDANNIPNDNDNSGRLVNLDLNYIFGNTGRGVDLGFEGITPNDARDVDGGANLQQNFPEFPSSGLTVQEGLRKVGEPGNALINVNANLNSTPNKTFTVHWYFSSDAQCSAGQAASRPLVFSRIPNVNTNSNGDASFVIPLDFPAGINQGIINCTATDSDGNTSEYSACLTVSAASSQWQPVVLTAQQIALINTWTVGGRTYVYVKPQFPDAGYRVADWGTPVKTGTDFVADAAVEKFTGSSVQAVTTTAQIYDLGPLAAGSYTFTFKNSGTLVKSQAFTVSATTPPPNPIDTAREFVKQQYRDFLGREADPAGENFWTDNIAKCSDPARRPAGQTEAQCTLRQRETTSGAFFLSPEFQYTGYYVYRVYQGALGRRPKLSEFLLDAQFVGNGIVVNGQLSAAVINQNKAAFAAQFVNCTNAARYRCSEFKAIYDPLNNTQYVDKLFLTTGVNASASDRTALVNGLNGGSETRASVLQKIVDGITVVGEGNQQFTTTYGQAFYNSELTRAFVQLQYFGYMKRDPDDAGYAFWLGKLNQFGGNFVNAEMVLAFISSPEYRSRFGQP